MRTIIALLLLVGNLFCTGAQNDSVRTGDATADELIKRGVWFLFSTRTEEMFKDEALTQVDFFKKDDVSSILFDTEDKLFSVFSKDGGEMWEDRWRMVNATSFVMVSPVDESTQMMDILELTPTKLVLRNCSDIEDGSRCVTHTYFSSKSGWLPDKEVDELNSAGVIELDKMTALPSN